MGFAIVSLNVCQSLRGFTRRNLNSENSSSTLFCLSSARERPHLRINMTFERTYSGVPVRHQRNLLSRAQHACAAFVFRFLMLWASSKHMQASESKTS